MPASGTLYKKLDNWQWFGPMRRLLNAKDTAGRAAKENACRVVWREKASGLSSASDLLVTRLAACVRINSSRNPCFMYCGIVNAHASFANHGGMPEWITKLVTDNPDRALWATGLPNLMSWHIHRLCKTYSLFGTLKETTGACSMH